MSRILSVASSLIAACGAIFTLLALLAIGGMALADEPLNNKHAPCNPNCVTGHPIGHVICAPYGIPCNFYYWTYCSCQGYYTIGQTVSCPCEYLGA